MNKTTALTKHTGRATHMASGAPRFIHTGWQVALRARRRQEASGPGLTELKAMDGLEATAFVKALARDMAGREVNSEEITWAPAAEEPSMSPRSAVAAEEAPLGISRATVVTAADDGAAAGSRIVRRDAF